MLIQAAANGDLAKADHPGVPVSLDELVRDGVACVAAGARALHLHPRDADGHECLESEVVDAVVAAVRGACDVPVGVSTGAWIEPDLGRRLELVRRWRAPDFASVNVSEAGAEEVAAALLDAGVGIEAGVWTVEDAERIARWPTRDQLTRILVEPVDVGAGDALAIAEAIHEALDRGGLRAPRLQHGDGEATWVLLRDAIRRGLDTRIGFEDTLHGPSGDLASDNAALVRAARDLATSPRPPSS